MLDADVRIRGVSTAPDGFDARFSAIWRRYAYRIADSPPDVDPLARAHVVAWPRPLDLDAMNEAAEVLLGEHDFAAFCRRREGATTIRDAAGPALGPGRRGWPWPPCAPTPSATTMVRALVGCLVAVGEGRHEPGVGRAGARGRAQRDPAVKVMPAHGLTLEEVAYPADAELGSARGRRGPALVRRRCG